MTSLNISFTNRHLRGFTVVELLIVIVAIVILATLGATSYRGIQAKTRNVQTSEVAQIYIDALVLYHAKYGVYPTGNADFKTCLGIGYPAGKCWKGEINENTAFMQSLKEVYGDKLPMSANQSIGLRGMWYKAAGSGLTNTLDGQPADFVVYSMEGASTKCPVGPLASDAGDTNIFTYSSTPPASGQTHPAGLNAPDEPVQCWVPLSLVK